MENGEAARPEAGTHVIHVMLWYANMGRMRFRVFSSYAQGVTKTIERKSPCVSSNLH